MMEESETNEPGPSTANTIKSCYVDLKTSDKKTSAFSSAFSKLKESEFFEKVPEELEAAIENNKGTSNKNYSKNSITVSSRQRGNPILQSIRNVPWEYGEIVPDYVMGTTTCALFLSLKYHSLNPDYIHKRMKDLGKQYELRILLVQVDQKDPQHELKQLTKICMMADFTLMLAWSADEAGSVLETYKMFEHKPPDLIMEKQDSNPHSMMIDALTSVRSINRTDAMTLLSNFENLKKILQASPDELAMCPGIGPLKASKLHAVLHQKFMKGS